MTTKKAAAKPAAPKGGKRKLSVTSLLTLAQLPAQDIELILDTAKDLKAKQKAGRPAPLLAGKTLAAIFEKSSTRTRVSFEVAMHQLGGVMYYLAGRDLQLGRGESIADTARVLSRYVDGITIRTDDHRKVVEMSKNATIPVINALTDYSHPCQILADLFTLKERFGKLKGLRVAYIGDGNNVARSLIFGAAKTGVQLVMSSPAEYAIDKQAVDFSDRDREKNHGELYFNPDPIRAAQGADAVYTDVWVSMGQEKEHALRLRAFKKYQINAKLMANAAPSAVFMHCLPAHRGEEVSEDVIDGPQSIVFDQAENRLHVQKAILALLMGDK
ncbi:MAG: ornithine carbamoyltransferase [Candidatus Firestonebacteria bacterium]|nr:ornithine carbamoyltransferase [Candidatus Firestonebacteria bacterium]